MRCEWQRRAAGTGHTAPAGWGWRECAEPPATEACALAEFSDTVLLFGGYSEAAEEDDDQAQEGEPEEDEDKMLCFAAGVASGKWWRGRLEMPQLEGLTAGGVPAARWAQGPAAGGRCAVLFGGQDTDLSARSDLWLVTLAGSGAPVVSALQPSGAEERRRPAAALPPRRLRTRRRQLPLGVWRRRRRQPRPRGSAPPGRPGWRGPAVAPARGRPRAPVQQLPGGHAGRALPVRRSADRGGRPALSGRPLGVQHRGCVVADRRHQRPPPPAPQRPPRVLPAAPDRQHRRRRASDLRRRGGGRQRRG
eukprot:TRINITY_DN36843_c0_g1_i2.p1 TRINITY_DN36843_c0_g1~~TRINITY_DN36843_c0_g1_i2.p1  ORF type:complete len:326 (+),score=11.21 TRINITY_DN36843_c0_g1_i2:62-979(+)